MLLNKKKADAKCASPKVLEKYFIVIINAE